MIHDSHVQIVKAQTRGRRRARHAARSFDRGRGWVFAEALGPPRLWAASLRLALESFTEHVDRTRHEDSYSLSSSVTRVREQLVSKGSEYLGPNPLNIGLAAFHLDANALHTVTSGSGRVEFHHAGDIPERISQRGREDVGLLRGRSVSTKGEYSPGGLIIAGSDGVFSDATIQRVGEALRTDTVIGCAALASILTESPIDDQGAIVLTLRLETI